MNNFFLQSHNNTTQDVVQSYDSPPDWFTQLHANVPLFDDYTTPDVMREVTITDEDFEHTPLGIITKSSSTPENTGFASGRKKSKSKTTSKYKTTYAPFVPSIYQLNSVTGEMCQKEIRRSARYKLLQIAQQIMPATSRVNSCLRYRINKDDNVNILQHQAHSCLHYGNLMRCGSVWQCAVCTAKISEVRRLELQKAKDVWLAQGGYVYMLTLTTPHYSNTDLKGLLDGQAKALKKMWGGREAVRLKSDLGLVGMIRAFEVTYSDKNGYHPHYHILLFCHADLSAENVYEAFGKRLGVRWQNACKSVGLATPSLQHGCQLQDGSAAFKYISKFGMDDDGMMGGELGEFIAKRGGKLPQPDGFVKFSNSKNPNYIKVKTAENNVWNSSHELTKANSKKGKKDSLTPFDFLRNYNDNPQKYGELWRIYADATHGKAQLFWSRGLKKLLGIDKNTDDDIAQNPAVSEFVGDNTDLSTINNTDKNSEFVYAIPPIRWELVRKNRLQHDVLVLCKQDLDDGGGRLDELLQKLVQDEIITLEAKLKALPPKVQKAKSKLDKKQLALFDFDKKYGSLAPKNPYPDGSPSWEVWEQKHGFNDKLTA